MVWGFSDEFSSGIFNLEFDIILILMTVYSAAILKMEFGYEYGRLFQPPFMNWMLTLML